MNVNERVLDALRGGLIVSVQVETTSVLNTPGTIALLARCAVANGAAGVRIEGSERIRAVRAAVDVPIVGLSKRAYTGFAPYITSTQQEIAEVAAAGADVVAFDATLRPHADDSTAETLVAACAAQGRLAMADCSDASDARVAASAGAALVATTLAGYTSESHGRPLPAFDVVSAIAAWHPFAVCEGGIREPRHVQAAFTAGASCVVVGTSLTNIDVLVRRFIAAVPRSTT